MTQYLPNVGQHKPADPDILIVFDAGYDVTRLAFLLADLPVELLGRLRSDRVFCSPPPPREPSAAGRPSKHGPEFALADPATQPEPDAITHTDTSRYGTARARGWNRLHPRLTHRAAWKSHQGPLPLIEGSIIQLQVDRLPGDRNPTPVWLWYSRPELTYSEVNRLWRAFPRRFDLEHTFGVPQTNPGLDPAPHPHTRPGQPLDLDHHRRHTQLRLARHLTHDLRRPWEKPVTQPHRLTPARIRRGFRNLRPKTTLPASAPKPSRPRPGRPPGSKNRHPAHRHDVGKNATTKAKTS